jgi:hypothetical protein
MRLEDIAIAGCAFFAGMFALTYVSRIADPLNVWSGISICLLLLVWGLGRNNWRISLAAIICTILGVILPVYGFSIGARGVMLSIAALLSVTWLAVRNWYNWYHLAPTDSGVDRPIYEDPEGVFTRQDLLEESAQYNQINPATPSTDDITQRLQDKT